MFGLEDQKKKKQSNEFTFDLEKDLLNAKKQKDIRGQIEKKLMRVKDALKKGTEKLDFDRIGVILQGYASLLKIIDRTKPKV